MKSVRTKIGLVSSVFVVSCFSPFAKAGIIEVGASGSYRQSNITTDSYDQSQSITGTVAYYFNEASALEASYTSGENKRVISEGQPGEHMTKLYYSSIGLDFVYTVGSRESAFRPYVKAGANYIIEKRIVDQYRNTVGDWERPTIIEEDPALVPSVGAGFKIMLTKTLSLKIGVDGWTSQPLSETPVMWDYAGRAGLSFLF